MVQKSTAKTSLHNILYIWSLLNKDISYRQGMHEIAATLFTLVLKDESPIEFKEHDTYSLFFQIMKCCKKWYDTNHIQQDLALTKSCNQIFQVYLKTIHNDLYHHLVKFHISIHLFLIRWIRLLFISELSNLEDVYSLWDIIFEDYSQSKTFNSVEWIATAMLSLSNEKVLAATDSNIILSILMKPLGHSFQETYLQMIKSKEIFERSPSFNKLEDIEKLLSSAILQTHTLENKLDSSGLVILRNLQGNIAKCLSLLADFHEPVLSSIDFKKSDSSLNVSVKEEL
jgi:hypothetical protein